MTCEKVWVGWHYTHDLGSDLIRHHLSRRSEWKLYHGHSAIWSWRWNSLMWWLQGKRALFVFLFMLPTLPRCLTETGSTQLTWFFLWKLHIVLLRLFPLLSFCCCFCYHTSSFCLRIWGTWVEKSWKSFRRSYLRMEDERWRGGGISHLCKVSKFIYPVYP